MHIRMLIKGQLKVHLHTGRSVHFHLSRFTRPSFSIFWGSGSETRMQVAQLTMCLVVHCPDPPDSRRARLVNLYGCHYAWPLPEVNSTTVRDFTVPLSESRISPWTSRPRANCPSLVENVPPHSSYWPECMREQWKKFIWSVKYEREQYGRQSRTVCQHATYYMYVQL